ncbi:MAG: acetyl-CoA carboxylase biotin carboxyl carrier protein [Butyricicoccaceae bacterium]
MNEQEIRKYAGIMAELELTGLEITEGSRKVRLERSPGPAAQAWTPPAAAPAADLPQQMPLNYIRAPLVGVFYAAPAENADPFVRPGDRVKKGQVVCIIEAMKLMNEICAEEDGVIAEVCVTNGQIVEYGTELFRLRS